MNIASLVVLFNLEVLKVEPRILNSMTEAEREITVKCLREEATELEEAFRADDFIKSVDAAIDGIYFGLGALYKMGLNADQINACFAAVHSANMTKKKGINANRGDGSAADAVKPEGWVPPETAIAVVLGLPDPNAPKPVVGAAGDDSNADAPE